MTRIKKRLFILLFLGLMGVFVTVGLNWQSIVIEYKFWRDFESLGLNKQGYPEYKHHKSGIVMVHLPGGEFLMGSPPSEPVRDEEEKLHKVNLSSFLIAKYEVSNEQWKAVMGTMPSHFKGNNLPVNTISWEMCFGNENSFCKKLGFRLPTEAQWEYACRAGTTSPFYFGEGNEEDYMNCNGSYKKFDPAKHELDLHRELNEVHKLKPNKFGLHNMHGNIREWCLDWYQKGTYFSSQNLTGYEPCPFPIQQKVLKGGSFRSMTYECRSAARTGWRPNRRLFTIGFRPVYPLSP